MNEFRAELIERIKRTPTIESFRFKLEAKVDFLPGQFAQIIFDEKSSDNSELCKYLSLSASPTKEYVEVTKRLSTSGFSQRLAALQKGDTLLLKMPIGSCVFSEEYKKIGFLIGGIGITPVVSIIEYIMDKKLDTDVYLVYSNRSEDEIAFKAELDRWQAQNKNLKVLYTVTECVPKDATCVYGHISKDLLLKHTDDLNHRLLYIFGPPRMVDVMCNLTSELDCRKENIKTERFIGY